MLSSITYMTTSLWGSKLLAAEIWAKEQPQSIRAARFLRKQLELQSDIGRAFTVVKRFNKNTPTSLSLHIDELILSCAINPEEDHNKHLIKIKKIAKTALFENWGTYSIERLHSVLTQIKCNNISFRSVAQIADYYLSNKGYQASNNSLFNIYALKAYINLQYEEPTAALENFDSALSHYFSTEIINIALETAKQQNRQDLILKWNKLVQ